MRQHLKHIKTTRKRLADGSIRTHYYHRKTNKKIDGELGTPEFLASYVEAGKPDKGRAPAGTFHALVESYFASSSFSGLKPRTQRDYLRQSNIVLDAFARVPFGALENKRIRGDFRKWRDKLAKASPRQADYAIAFLSCVLSYGYDAGDLSVNHAKGMGRVYKSSRTDKIWEEADVEAFLRHASPEMALALHLALDTAQRQGDLIRLTWRQYTANRIELRQNKSDKPIYVPCTQLLRVELERTPKRATTILTGRRGRPWTEDGFRTEWRKIAMASGIQGRLTFHDLRGTAITRLAEAGCSVPEIATLSGHSVTEVASILEAYMARTNPMAESAIAKLEDKRHRNKS